MNHISKGFLLLLFLFFFEYKIIGQNDSSVQKGRFEIGITGGINYFNLRGNDIAVKNFTKGKIGDGGGITVQRNLNNIFAIHSALLFEEKNCVAEIPTGTSNLTYPGEVRRETKMAYYHIPVRNSASSEILKTNTFNIMLGLKIHFATKKKNDSTNTKEKKVFVKVFYSPHYSYRLRNGQEVRYGKYSQYDYAGHGSSYFVYDPAIETPKITSEFGFLIERVLSKHLNLTLGITLNHEGYTTKKSNFTIYSESQFTYTSFLLKDTTVLQNQSIDFDYYFLTAPFILNYQHKIKKHLYYIGMGLQPQILTKHNLQFSDAEKYYYLLKNYDLSKKRKVKDIETIALFYSVNFGVAFSLGDKLSLFIEPDCKIEIGRMSDIPGLWSAGCKLGIKF